jgi:hypothetical protein
MLFLLAAGASAVADSYTSSDLGFSADFPGTPTVGAPQGSEKDSAGNFISTLVYVNFARQGVYVAAVVEDHYDVPGAIDVPGTLTTERDNFLKAFHVERTSEHDDVVSGHPANFFTFDSDGHRAQGQGVVIVIDTPRPRIFIVATTYTPAASADDRAALDKFFASFKLLPGW